MSVRFIIYCHTSPVGKQYVGQTKLTMETRWNQHASRARSRRWEDGCRALHAAIRKYGPDTFAHEVLDVVTSEGGANLAERTWIRLRQSMSPNGYNLQSGGGVGRISSPETRAIRSANTSAHMASLTADERRERMRPAFSAITTELRSDNARKGFAGMSSERRSAIAVARWTNKTPETLEATRLLAASIPTEERRRRALKGHASLTADQRSAGAIKAQASISPERKSAIATKRQASIPAKRRSAIAQERMLSVNASRTPAERRQIAIKAAATRNANRRTAIVSQHTGSTT